MFYGAAVAVAAAAAALLCHLAALNSPFGAAHEWKWNFLNYTEINVTAAAAVRDR